MYTRGIKSAGVSCVVLARLATRALGVLVVLAAPNPCLLTLFSTLCRSELRGRARWSFDQDDT